MRAQVRRGDFSGINSAAIKVEPSILPTAYWRAKSALTGFAKAEAGTSRVAFVSIVPGNQTPVSEGERGGFFTKGGRRIYHPGAYSKTGWSNMEYRTNTEHVTVGIDWLHQELPKTVETFMQYAELENPQYGLLVKEYKAKQLAQKQERERPYNIDEPPLAETWLS